MRTPTVVADIARSMRTRLGGVVDVTVKCRLGLDDDTSYDTLCAFVDVVAREGGVSHFIIHARNAVLGGLSPAQNRNIPPIRYEVVYDLVRDFPHLRFSLNGGVKSVDDVLLHLQHGVYGVMVGRAVMDAPWHALHDVDARVYGRPNLREDGKPVTRRDVLRLYVPYAQAEVEMTGVSVRTVLKPLLNLFHGERNGKVWRRAFDDGMQLGYGVQEVVESASVVIPDDVMDAGCAPFVDAAGAAAAEEGRCTDARVDDGRGPPEPKHQRPLFGEEVATMQPVSIEQ